MTARGRKTRATAGTSWLTGYALAGPALVVMVIVLLYPLLYSAFKSLFRWNLGTLNTEFLGFGNYLEVFESTSFGPAFENQLIFTVCSLLIECSFGMAIAVLLNRQMRGLKPARTLLLIPPMIAPTVVGLNFRWLFNEQYGLIDGILQHIGLPSIPWLSDPVWALAAIILANTWQNTPLLVLLFLAGLQSIPKEPLESAAVDGASAWRTFWSVTLPLMRPVVVIALMIRIIDTFRTFDIVWMMTEGGPGNATNLLTVEAYKLAFQSVDFGHAAAVSYLALLASLALLGVLYGFPKVSEWYHRISMGRSGRPQ